MTIPSKYTFEDMQDGFKISAADRPTAYVKFTGTCFVVLSHENALPSMPIPPYQAIGMFDHTKLCAAISNVLMANWMPHKPVVKRPPTWALKKWASGKTAVALSKRINAKRKEIIAKANPLAVDMQRAYYAACGKFNYMLAQPALLTESLKFVAQDICKYRAAALASVDLAFSTTGSFCGWYSQYKQRRVGRDLYWGESEYLPNTVDSWMDIFCARHAKPNGPLRKTLMNLPGCIPYKLLQNINMRPLTRPFYDRVELLAYSIGMNGNFDRNGAVVERSNRKQIVRAINMVADHLRQTKKLRKLRKTNYLSNILTFIFDVPNTHNGNIVGLADKSIRWHRDRRYEDERRFCKHSEDTSVKLPPIALPTNKNIKFLRTVGEVFAEGMSMSHCVSGYASRAVVGDCYLFHVDYGEESATVEVSPQGEVRQARGPRNQTNRATRWAERLLREWGKTFPKQDRERIHDPEFAMAEMPF